MKQLVVLVIGVQVDGKLAIVRLELILSDFFVFLLLMLMLRMVLKVVGVVVFSLAAL